MVYVLDDIPSDLLVQALDTGLVRLFYYSLGFIVLAQSIVEQGILNTTEQEDFMLTQSLGYHLPWTALSLFSVWNIHHGHGLPIRCTDQRGKALESAHKVEYQFSEISLLANESFRKQMNKDPEGYGKDFGMLFIRTLTLVVGFGRLELID
ncbi:La-related protein [Sesbania bispinosa]|nr:La-related protein [Sesbania bispinosa]